MWEKTFFGLISLFLVALLGMLRAALLKEVKRAEERAQAADKKADEVRLLLQEESKAVERRFHELKTTDIAQSMEQKELEKKLRNLDGSFHHQSGDLERRILAHQGQVEKNTELGKEARGLAIEGKAKVETLERVVSSLLTGRTQESGERQAAEESAPTGVLPRQEQASVVQGEERQGVGEPESQALAGTSD